MTLKKVPEIDGDFTDIEIGQVYGEVALWLKVVLTALSDYGRIIHGELLAGCHRRRAHEKHAVKRWLLTERAASKVGSLDWIAENCTENPDKFRKWVRTLAEQIERRELKLEFKGGVAMHMQLSRLPVSQNPVVFSTMRECADASTLQ